jgi:hypothetical protein
LLLIMNCWDRAPGRTPRARHWNSAYGWSSM